MTEDEFREIVEAREQAGVEFKRGGALSNKQLVAQIARAVLALTNRRDGGLVLVGVEDSGEITGIEDSDFATWKDDHLRDKLDPFADPYVQFRVERVDVSGAHCIVLRVSEFDDVPVFCSKPHPPVLQQGVLYVRSRRKPESVPVSTQADMRDLITLAVEKALARHRTLVNVSTRANPGIVSRERYAAELRDFLP